MSQSNFHGKTGNEPQKSIPLKLLSAILAIFMLAGAFVACTKEPDDPTASDGSASVTVPPDSVASGDASASASASAEVPETKIINAKNVLGERDLGGQTITFYARDYSGVWRADIVSYGMEGEAINDAIYRRTKTIEEEYKVKLEMLPSGKQSFYSDAIRYIESGDSKSTFDVLLTSLRDAAYLAPRGVILNLKKVPNISLDKDYWSPFLSEQLSIDNRVYFAVGEISAVDNMSVRCVFFNKTMAKDLNIPDLYRTVNDYEWTYEKMFELAESALHDDGNGTYDLKDEGDTFGIVAQAQLGFILLMGSGERVISKDAQDAPMISLGSEKSVQIVDLLTKKINGNPAVQLTGDNDVIGTFTAGRALFMPEVLQHAETMRLSESYDIDFGILPMPMYDKEQKKYIQYSDAYCPNFYSIPNTTKGGKLDDTTFILEALALESVGTLTPAYYDTCLKTRYSMDYDSSRMIDIILSNYSIDLCDVYLDQWGGFRTLVQNCIRNGSSITNLVRMNGRPVKIKIAETLAQIKELP